MTAASCPYCKGTDLAVAHTSTSHKVVSAFGPFDLLVCQSCGSLSTKNLPNLDQLADFYGRYDEHRPVWYNAASVDQSLQVQYRFYADYLAGHFDRPDLQWADIGAGHGEVANDLSERFPNSVGHAVDIGARPTGLTSRVSFLSADMNESNWSSSIGRQFDLVFAVAVLEHVMSPSDFVTQCLSLLRPNGLLVMIAPDNGSLASRVLGRHWPYFEPGEHLTIPTRRGAVACLKLSAESLGLSGPLAPTSQTVWVRYSLRYLAQVLRLPRLARFIPKNAAFPLPTGILAAKLRLPNGRA